MPNDDRKITSKVANSSSSGCNAEKVVADGAEVTALLARLKAGHSAAFLNADSYVCYAASVTVEALETMTGIDLDDPVLGLGSDSDSERNKEDEAEEEDDDLFDLGEVPDIITLGEGTTSGC